MRHIAVGTTISAAGLLLAFALSQVASPGRPRVRHTRAPDTPQERTPAFATTEPAASSAATAAVPASTVSSPDSEDDAEKQRIQKFIDLQYKRSDVVSSFRTRFDEVIDCIPFTAQASVRALVAHGKKVPTLDLTKVPTPAPRTLGGHGDPADDVAFRGQPDQDGNPRKCFDDTVPMVRHTVAEIKAEGGLAAYLKNRSRKAPAIPPANPEGNRADDPGYMHVVAQLGDGGAPIQLGQTTMSIHKPSVGNGSHSLSQLWLTTGRAFAPCEDDTPTGSCVAASGSECIQTIEVGWIVQTGNPNPTLFTFSTQDGYWSTGCYNTESCATEACYFNAEQLGVTFPSSAPPCNSFPDNGNLVPNPLIVVSGAKYTPGMALPVSSGNTPNELGVTVLLPPETNLWLLYVNVAGVNEEPLAYWPGDTWDGGVYTDLNGGVVPAGIEATPGAPLGNAAQTFQVGGEVAGAPGTTGVNPFTLSTAGGNPAAIYMGSGWGGAVGYQYSAYHRNVGITYLGSPPGDVPFFPVGSPAGNVVYATDMNCYSYGYGLADGGPQTISLENLGYTFLQYDEGSPSSYESPVPGASDWGNYLYFGGFGNYSGVPFSYTDPNGGTYDFCCSTKAQNGVNDDNECPNSQSTTVCP